MKYSHLQLMGRRITSELNDLKRTPQAAAEELNISLTKIKQILSGECSVMDTQLFILKMGEIYPIDVSDLFLLEDDCKAGIKIMRESESKSSSRIFKRKNKSGDMHPYYEYRDTAMSKLAPFKPEWIKELRVVKNPDPNNPDVAYNKGHFLHQITFFIGSVNFYWKADGKAFCKEMNTGDSNYITPYCQHSFTRRDNSEKAIIIAVTFGSEVRRAQKELYWLGKRRTEKYKLLGGGKQYGSIPPEKVVVKNKEKPTISSSYKIRNLAEIPSPIMARGYDIEILGKEYGDKLESFHHSYLYNYGNSDVHITWEWDGDNQQQILNSGDSVYIQPLTKYCLKNKGANAKIISIEVGGAINELAQVELSYFPDNARIANETKIWF